VLDVVEDGDGGVAGEHEVAVHAVDGEVCGDGELGGGEALGDYGAAVDAAGSRGVPEGARVGEDVLWERRKKLALWLLGESVSLGRKGEMTMMRGRIGGGEGVDVRGQCRSMLSVPTRFP
jgi:hypothetical protein